MLIPYTSSSVWILGKCATNAHEETWQAVKGLFALIIHMKKYV